MRIFRLLLKFLIVMPMAYGAEEATKCGLRNLAICIPQKMFEYILTLVNAPLIPLISFVKSLLTAQVNVSLFHGIWGIMVYLLSLFYGLFFIIAGFNLMISGYDVQKRDKAKKWFRDSVLMVFFVQSSFLIYSLVLEISSGLNSGAMNLIDPSFFLITTDNIANIGFELLFFMPYVGVLLTTAILLVLRYLAVAVGVVFLPLGIFFYFTPPLKAYGKLILDSLFVIVFLPFIQILVLLSASKVIDISLFSNFKILVMISAFAFVDLLVLLLAFFVVMKATSSLVQSDTGRVIVAGAKTMV